MSARCPYCHGRGFISVEPGSSLTYPCPDCVFYESEAEEDDEEREEDE